ncbi:hypothetical protein [Arsenicibacter rosenii]|uniref:Uncharacterized protein n=1 Tax=Arsenicibacter rosenii TaxID=1750698 RepID=A0A1S2VKA1_9BACT|nr:hypothetical protein [Arsenicibacter rosenii]OIN58248.1 hypothetical protein BLX24_14670 [Arsenicibacter rosenii]
MNTNLLFPHRYRLIGWLIFLPSAVLGLFYTYAEFKFAFLTLQAPDKKSSVYGLYQFFFDNLFGNTNFTDEVAAIGIITGLLFIAFAREKHEDEMIQHLRLESLQWSVYANYIILSLAIILIHGSPFLSVMIYNMFTILLVFVIRFRLLLYKNSRELEKEVGV